LTAYVPSLTEKDPAKLVLAIQQLTQGRSNATGVFTLAISAATTTITDNNCAAGSVIIPIPTTANAAAELGNGTMFLSSTTNGTFTFTHANSATTGRTFKYAILG
jgi:hypothetical protein